jgi:hypothetical protein
MWRKARAKNAVPKRNHSISRSEANNNFMKAGEDIMISTPKEL